MSLVRVACPQPNDSTAPQRILISQCFGSRTISGNHLFRQDSEHGRDLESKSGKSPLSPLPRESAWKEVAKKHVLVLSVRLGGLMERPSVKPSASIAVHYIH